MFHVEYDGDGLLAIRDHLGESRYKGQVKVRPKRQIFNLFNFVKQRHVADAEYPQESNRAIIFTLCGLEFPKITFYCMTSPLYVIL